MKPLHRKSQDQVVWMRIPFVFFYLCLVTPPYLDFPGQGSHPSQRLWPKPQGQPCRILNPPCREGDWTCVPALPRCQRSPCPTAGAPEWECPRHFLRSPVSTGPTEEEPVMQTSSLPLKVHCCSWDGGPGWWCSEVASWESPVLKSPLRGNSGLFGLLQSVTIFQLPCCSHRWERAAHGNAGVRPGIKPVASWLLVGLLSREPWQDSHLWGLWATLVQCFEERPLIWVALMFSPACPKGLQVFRENSTEWSGLRQETRPPAQGGEMLNKPLPLLPQCCVISKTHSGCWDLLWTRPGPWSWGKHCQ